MGSMWTRRLFNAGTLGALVLPTGATAPAAAVPVHPVWGDLAPLQAPPELDSPLIVDDYTPFQVVRDGLVQAFVDGGGGDLLLRAHRPGTVPTAVDFTIQVTNFRRLHVQGLAVRIDDEAKIRGGSHTKSRYGQGEVVSISRAPHAEEVFVEGVHGDMGDVCRHTDLISMHSLGSVARPLQRVVIQNFRAVGIGIADSNVDNSGGHCDAVHLQGKLWTRRVHVENCYVQSGYQGLQMVLSTMQGERRRFVAANTLMPQTLYDLRRVAVNNANRFATACISVDKRAEGGGAPSPAYFPRLRLHDVHLAKRNKRGEARVQTQWFMAPAGLYTNPEARHGPPRWRPDIDCEGTWVRHYDAWRLPDYAPADRVGLAYASPWS